ncbi:MAG: SDR family oxidoreductase [Myxococcota bacterium]
MADAEGRPGSAVLRGRGALVTGGGKRVGAAIARHLGALGMRVAVHHHASAEGAEATCRTIRAAGGEAFPLQADLRDRQAARELVDRAVERLGELTLLVPSAANFERVSFDQVDGPAWDRALRLNLEAPFFLAHRAAPHLRRARGAIVFITCTSASVPYRGYLPYVVSKGAVQKMMRVLALELAPEARVNAVAPGTVLPPPDMEPVAVEALERRIPLERIGSAQDVAEAVAYLAAAPFVTGQEIVVDGGRTIAATPPRGRGEQA